MSESASLYTSLMRLSDPNLMMSDIGLTLAKIGLSKSNVKLVIMSNHGQTGLMITTKSSLDEKEHIQSYILHPRESNQ